MAPQVIRDALLALWRDVRRPSRWLSLIGLLIVALAKDAILGWFNERIGHIANPLLRQAAQFLAPVGRVLVDYVLTPATIIVGFFLLLLGHAYWIAWRREREAANSPVAAMASKPATTGSIAPRGNFGGQFIPGPSNLAKSHFVQWTTANRVDHHMDTGQRLQALRFVYPTTGIFRAIDLPVEFSCGSGKLIVKRFPDRGFVIGEINTGGDEIKVEVYHAAMPTGDEEEARWIREQIFVQRQIVVGDNIAKSNSPNRQRAEARWLGVTYAGLLTHDDQQRAAFFGDPALGFGFEDSLVRLKEIELWTAGPESWL